jgi:hypothetical protein
VNLDNVRREDWTVGGLALVLAIFLLVLPWFHFSASGTFVSVSFDFSATDDPDGWLAILAVIVSLAVVADLAVEKLSPQTQLPEIGGSRGNTRFILACVAAGFVALKFLFHIHFSDFGWGFYACVVVTIAFVYFAAQARMSPSVASYPTPPAPPPSEPAGTSSGPTGGSTPPPGS